MKKEEFETRMIDILGLRIPEGDKFVFGSIRNTFKNYYECDFYIERWDVSSDEFCVSCTMSVQRRFELMNLLSEVAWEVSCWISKIITFKGNRLMRVEAGSSSEGEGLYFTTENHCDTILKLFSDKEEK